ncbi:MAG: GIY-YIG nuclease family protein [Brumimicrobium sp.]|nr:GIY-YIG nuclease family protein [Brumimicrobium sp.]MCO5267943.1 GIY-YIG nuclease family protein [Brumimicrobium sp.]
MSKSFYIYILTNFNRTTLYIGVTNTLVRRLREHISQENTQSFTVKYNIKYCVYYELFTDIRIAIAREKEIKKWHRIRKIKLIESRNINWKTFAYNSLLLQSFDYQTRE